jgi:hypothetical protein
MNTLNQTLAHVFAAVFNRSNNDTATQTLLERANRARGQSATDAAQLRRNALAMLRVVR